MTLVFTLAASIIWAINTIFLIRLGGLSLFQVMLVNAIFTVSQMVFEVPTGVIADTIGRKASILLCTVTLLVSTLLYVLTPRFGWGFAGFAAASVLIGLGYTFQSGATEAWLVDALDSCGYALHKERVFARGQIAMGVGMLTGSLLGGLLGQVDLTLPYLVRAGLLAVCFFVVLLMVRDEGFEPRPLKASTFAAESRRSLRRRSEATGGEVRWCGRCCGSRRSVASSSCTASTLGSPTCWTCWGSRTRCGSSAWSRRDSRRRGSPATRPSAASCVRASVAGTPLRCLSGARGPMRGWLCA